jgi:hypothetical protein
LDAFAQDRVRHADAEVVDIARSVKRPPIDVAVLFTIYASGKKLSYTTKIRTRMTGRLLNLKSSKRLGNFEVELPQSDNAPVQCNRECILETVGKNARVLGMDLRAVLAKKLEAITPRSRGGIANGNVKAGISSVSTMVFRGFTPGKTIAVEEYIAVFKGY